MQVYKDCLNQLEIGNHKTPPQISYYTPESAYYTPQQPAAGIPPATNIPHLNQNQWTRQTKFQHQEQRPRNRFRNRSQWGGRQPVQFSHSPNVAYPHQAPPYQVNQPMGGRGGRRVRRQGICEGTGNMKATHVPSEVYVHRYQKSLPLRANGHV